MFIPTTERSKRPDVADGRPIWTVSRRGFVAGSGAFVVALSLAGTRVSADSAAAGLPTTPGGDVDPSLFIAIEPDGTVRLTCHRSEMGQQVWTAMAQILADELEVDWDRIVIDQAEGHPRYGDQNTDGSRSVRWNFLRLRQTGAAMRAMLVATAAERWGVDPAECNSALGIVTGPGGQTAAYGELAEDAATRAMPGEAEFRLKDRSEWRYIGQPVPSLTVPQIVRGEGTFGIDVLLDGMVHAVIARPPAVFGSVASVDDTAALEVPGVLRTIWLPTIEAPAGFKPLGGVAILAEDTYAAIQGRYALDITWNDGPNADYDTTAFAAAMMETARQPGAVRRNRGDVDTAFANATTRLEAEYFVPHLAQSPMEPPVATARWEGDRVECWACVQAPQAARSTVAQVCGVPEENVTIRVTWLGGGFGRKSKPDFVAEAALLAREIGRPVKVTWTREDDLQHGYYHSISAQRLEGGLDAEGSTVAFLHRTVFPPIPSTFAAGQATPSWGELGLGASDTPFATPNLRLESGDAPAHLRIGWLRSVSNIYHAFAVQSFVDELAQAAGRDPKDYLLDLVGPPRLIDPREEGVEEYDNYSSPLEEYPIDTGRMRNVIEIAAEMADWGRQMPDGAGLGIAMHRSFVTYCATVVEVAVDAEGRLTMPAVWSVLDAGTVTNTRHTAAQIEGGTLYGLSNALYGAITATDGAVDQVNFPDWRIMRMRDAPRRFESHIVESDAPPGGVGEPPTPPAAPALTNAIFAATGVRFRRLPIIGPDRDTLPLSDPQET
ncbi:molybdopterin cofactor-binding domain-containing protein [uncultured Roseobacter sp.]|uniref:xanthine dehydrogenase family protein molybdopterin-binding subunit n=1 Tax=uncultured Roseobacter sp. TaxID=114847 RepID=UPI00260EFE95|nr:molybdopterin cofactor-binding domain-containing protein [uncultured Roseobacter sp.]